MSPNLQLLKVISFAYLITLLTFDFVSVKALEGRPPLTFYAKIYKTHAVRDRLSVIPSRTEGFGLTALEALSACLPFLVSQNSGFADTLGKVQNGLSCVVDSKDPQH